MNADSADGVSSIRGVAGNSGNVHGILRCRDELRQRGDRRNLYELEEAVLYKAGERKGQVYARGVLRHTQDEHTDLDLGTVRWYLIVHNVVGASYTLSGKGTAQFD